MINGFYRCYLNVNVNLFESKIYSAIFNQNSQSYWDLNSIIIGGKDRISEKNVPFLLYTILVMSAKKMKMSSSNYTDITNKWMNQNCSDLKLKASSSSGIFPFFFLYEY